MPKLPAATDPAPGDWRSGSAVWLLPRHPRLERWVRRIPGAWTMGDPIHPYEPEVLFEAIRAHDALHTYENPDAEPTPGSNAYGVMSSGERAGLRMLAFLTGPVQLSISDARGFDAEGEELLSDWTAAILAHHRILPR